MTSIQRSVNPFNGEVLAEIPEFSDTEIIQAISLADAAFKSWKKSSWDTRSELLIRCSEQLLRKKEDLAKMITGEMGKMFFPVYIKIIEYGA